MTALCIACGVSAELGTELCGLDPEGRALSFRHGVLAGVGVGAMATFFVYLLRSWRSATGVRDFKRLLRLDLDALPRATSQRHALTFALTFGCGLAAQLGQTDLTRPGDVLGWFVAALISAALLAFIVRAVVRRLPDAVIALFAFLARCIETPTHARRSARSVTSWTLREGALSTLWSRPPPTL